MASSTNDPEEMSAVTYDHTQTTIDEDEEKHFRKIVGAFLYYR
jgi:hypothetical protein